MRMISERSIFTNGGRTTARGNLPSSTSASFRAVAHVDEWIGVEHPHQRLDTVIEPLGLGEVVALHRAEQARLQFGDHATGARQQSIAAEHQRREQPSTARGEHIYTLPSELRDIVHYVIAV
jgi:hypothetical protein